MSDRFSINLHPIVLDNNWAFEVRIADDGGVPINISGRRYVFTAKHSLYQQDKDAVIRHELTASGTDAENGILIFSVPASKLSSQELQPVRYYYDLTTVVSDVPHMMFSGRVKAELPATRTV